MFRPKEAIQKHLHDALGVKVEYQPWDGLKLLPHLLKENYTFFKGHFLENAFLFFCEQGESQEFSPAKIAKQRKIIEAQVHMQAIFVAESLESFNRKRLIEQKVPFIVPGNQLYMPDLGLDLREHIKKVREKTSFLSPSAQQIMLVQLLKIPAIHSWTATSLGKVLNTSKMSMGRAIDELEKHNLIATEMVGKEKQIQFAENNKEVFARAKGLMKSPVLRRIFLKNLEDSTILVAGLSALSQKTMLNPPNRKVVALSQKHWAELNKKESLEQISHSGLDLAQVELEIWKYDPRLFTQENTVDSISLYLSLRELQDERVEGELDTLIGSWT